MAPRTGPAAGFTLLEMVVALAAAGTALAFGSASFGLTVDRMETTKTRVDRDLTAAELRSRVTDWIAGASLDSDDDRRGSFFGIDATVDGIPDDMLILPTRSRSPIGEDETDLRLFIDRDAETPEAGLVVEFQEPVERRTVRLELDPTAVGLDLQYRSAMTGPGRWLASWISSSVLPRGVAVRITHHPSSSPHPLRRLPLRIPIERGR